MFLKEQTGHTTVLNLGIHRHRMAQQHVPCRECLSRVQNQGCHRTETLRASAAKKTPWNRSGFGSELMFGHCAFGKQCSVAKLFTAPTFSCMTCRLRSWGFCEQIYVHNYKHQVQHRRILSTRGPLRELGVVRRLRVL